ncbi:uncharacterized protein IL334_005685 [Kwoniella shivajii]|uniref:Uncharacterized protein n=1 Tax=Kwoniella shivajii TaxID=564305 RepID=A0ABZ1D5P5_9TREE|nr:hypothetical protein IL334_005685 [Kwoniella shivajii]
MAPPKGYTNPFYTSPPPTTSTPPPAYNNSTRPSSTSASAAPHPASNQPTTYGSLSDLSRGRTDTAQTYSYQPKPERQGYRSTPEPSSSSSGSGLGTGGRRVPPLGREGMMPHTPPEPPRRNVPTTPPPPPSRIAQIQGYIPESAQNTFGVAADRVTDGWRSVATTERKDQVLSGIGKLGVGAAKLGAKGVYQIGKFASK